MTRTTQANPDKAIGYVRVSTDMQADNGVSLDMQRAKIEAYCSLHDLELTEVIEDAGYSAKNLNRPGVQRLIEMVDAGEIGAIIIYKLDRMSRRTRDVLDLVERLEQTNVALHSIQESLDTKSAIGRFVLRTLASLAEMERDLISERTRDAIQHIKAEGKPYRGKMFVDADTIRWMHTERATGRTYCELAELLNVKGIPTARGGRWDNGTVRKILLRSVA